MRPSDRLDYSAISERPPRTLPNGKKVAVWVIVNIEEWSDEEPMPRTVLSPPAGGVPTPDVPNWCWHEYGNRVGFWRLLKVLDQHGIPVALAVNGSAVNSYRAISAAAVERNWEFVGHGYGQKNMQKVADEREDIRRTTEAIRTVTGKAPRGWLGPGLTETWETPDILVEEGYQYVCDWVLDDQPVELRTRTTPITSIPYTQECNDVAMMLIQHHPAREYLQRATDQFDQLADDADDSARVMALVIHPYIMAAPHRLTYVDQALAHIREDERAVFMTGEQILEWHRGTAPR
ncbi:Polysaccharide deacetylase [Brevibacterium sandarakinum]|uniref:Polysaccharide deacetylase n=1 Tax=Brevibacterium sandarakinum TaxID=629680 RepID=A0A1H1NV61_BRESA|nr:polysaccharide deacetylase family protein [Brevibacterium sandarakinum]SDS02700.1 Polysaccharide deacetylase [Brevibacterium sandarakinum]